MKIILGSSSPFRLEVMREMNLDFDVVEPNIDEKSIRSNSPEDLVIILSKAKAKEIIKKIISPAIIIACDQVVTYKGDVREKPKDLNEAREFLQSYGISPSVTVNGITVVNTKTGKMLSSIDKSFVYLKPVDSFVIDKLLDEGVVMKCAGALRLEDPLMRPFIKKLMELRVV